MMSIRSMAALGIAAAVTAGAQGNPLGFVEDFEDGPANWRDAAGANELDWFPSGGPDGSAYASSLFNLQNATGGFPPIVIRAHAAFGSSGGAYTGDWIAAGVTAVSFDFRHDLSEGIEVTGRFANPQNRGASTETSFLVAPDTWTRITFDVTEDSPDIISLGGLSYEAIFSNIANVQFGFNVPEGLGGQDIDARFDIDNFAVIPAPGSAALGLLLGLASARRRR